ncbi:MAG: FliM/FliN family flagellar motor switch protein [Deltaproteobacteria bacterium]|nr:FliM/FliN family flagellar motor switch protein [Deltaproteobacteria bacterium]
MNDSSITRVDPRFAAEPFPFGALPAFARAEIVAAARLARVARAHVDLAAIEHAASELLGARVRAKLVDARPSATKRGVDDAVAVLFAPVNEHSAASRFLVELDGALGASVAARAVRQKPPAVHDPSKVVAPAVAGAVAAVLAAIARRANAGIPLRVIAAGPGAALARDLAATGPTTTATLALSIDGEVFGARFTVPDAAEVTLARPSLSHRSLVDMGDAVLALPIVIGSTLASREELRALATGDAFVPSGLGVGADAGGALLGRVALVAPASERGLGADLAEGGRLVLRGASERQPWDAEISVTTKTSTSTSNEEPVVDALDDAPVVVRVELGAVEMKAREWADLGPGDVVTLGRKLGDPAILRVGGVELARGELVQVDGEMAVRILSRTGERT